MSIIRKPDASTRGLDPLVYRIAMEISADHAEAYFITREVISQFELAGFLPKRADEEIVRERVKALAAPILKERSEDVLEVMKQLPRLYRTIVELTQQGYDHAAISRRMGFHASTAQRYEIEARAYLNRKLVEYRKEKPAIEARKKLRAERVEFAALAELLQITAVTVLMRAEGPIVCRCENGHQWQDTVADLKERGACPTCLSSRKLTRSHCVALGMSKKLRFSGAVPQTRHDKGTWFCGRGHINFGSWFAVIDWKG